MSRFVEQLEPRRLRSSAVISDDRQAIRADQTKIRLDFVQFRTTARLDRIAAHEATATDRAHIQNDLRQFRIDQRNGSPNAAGDLVQLQNDQGTLVTDIRNAAMTARQHVSDFTGQLASDRTALVADIKQLIEDLKNEPAT